MPDKSVNLGYLPDLITYDSNNNIILGQAVTGGGKLQVGGDVNITGNLKINGVTVQGVVGIQGAQGPQGTQGVQGVQGIGIQGLPGVQGQAIQGTQGPQSTQGVQGPQGLQGTQGIQGPQGSQGLQGTSGISDRYSSTSTTSLTIVSIGTITFTIATGLSWSIGQSAIVANSVANTMTGTVSAYNSGTGVMSVLVFSSTGLGTYSSWSVNLAGATGIQGTQGVQGTAAQNGTQGIQGVAGQNAQSVQGVQGAQGYNGLGYEGLTSTTSMTLQTGSVTFTVNKTTSTSAYVVGQRVRITYPTNTLYWMEGSITAYSGTTSMTVLVDLVNVSGNTYATWNIGIAGQMGQQGLQGSQGVIGQSVTGGQGAQGPTGSVGQAIQGIQGTQGPQGTTGVIGTGYNGLASATSLLLSTGAISFTTNISSSNSAFSVGQRIRLSYTTTPVTYWMEGVITSFTGTTMGATIDLVNVPGNTYSSWYINTAGEIGAIGLQGTQGTVGPQASAGPQGAQGGVGAVGQATQGAQGAIGVGTQGAVGSNGSNGSQGIQGFAGATGAQGYIGSTGGSGVQGYTGATGATGAQGYTGNGFSTISPAYNNSLVISNGTSNQGFTNSSVYVSGNTIYADAFYQNSSRSLKTNITSFDDNAVDLLKQVSVVTFYYNNDLQTPHIGFIAEDTPKELSGANQNMMDVPSVVGTLIKAVQELEAKINMK